MKPSAPMLAPKQRPLKPPSPLRPRMQANVKPPAPLLAPKQRPLKPATPLQPKNAPKTPISHPQRRCRFQLGLGLREQRRWWFHLRLALREQRRQRFQLGLALREQRRRRFHARDFQCTRAIAEPGRTTSRRAEPHISDQAPPVWRAPEGPEGTGGLRGAAPNEVRPPSLAGGRALRRPEHQRSRKQQAQPRIPAAPPVWRPPRGLQGLAGLRDDAPSEARGADGERAGRPRGGR